MRRIAAKYYSKFIKGDSFKEYHLTEYSRDGLPNYYICYLILPKGNKYIKDWWEK